MNVVLYAFNTFFLALIVVNSNNRISFCPLDYVVITNQPCVVYCALNRTRRVFYIRENSQTSTSWNFLVWAWNRVFTVHFGTFRKRQFLESIFGIQFFLYLSTQQN